MQAVAPGVGAAAIAKVGGLEGEAVGVADGRAVGETVGAAG